MNLNLIGHLLYLGGLMGGSTLAFIMFYFEHTTYIPHVIVGGLLVAGWTAVIALARQATRNKR